MRNASTIQTPHKLRPMPLLPPPPPTHCSPQVLLALGGRAKVARRLRGRLRMSWRYTRRLQDVEDSYAALGPESRAYQNPALKYAALQGAPGTAGYVCMWYCWYRRGTGSTWCQRLVPGRRGAV